MHNLLLGALLFGLPMLYFAVVIIGGQLRLWRVTKW